MADAAGIPHRAPGRRFGRDGGGHSPGGTGGDGAAADHGLSAREKEVVDFIVRGFSTRQISKTLYISESTVQGHLSHVFEKVGVKSRGELLKRLFLDNLSLPA